MLQFITQHNGIDRNSYIMAYFFSNNIIISGYYFHFYTKLV